MTDREAMKIAVKELADAAADIRQRIDNLRLNINADMYDLDYSCGGGDERNAYSCMDAADDGADDAEHYMEFCEKQLRQALEHLEG